MAMDYGDHASGFRHNEVIKFINNEVLMNGGSPDFYMAFRSRPWNEVEDQLLAVVVDPQVPSPIKRACAWSALALSVRVAARQQEQQAYRVQRLQAQLEEREVAFWSLSSQLQRLCKEREEVAAQLRCTLASLQQAMAERDVLRGRLPQAERSVQIYPLPQEIAGAEQPGAVTWPVDVGMQGMSFSEAQMADQAALLYMPGSSSPWAQAMQPPQQMPVPYPSPFYVPFPVAFPYSSPLPASAVMEAEAAAAAVETAAVAPQRPPPVIYPPVLRAAVGVQEEMAPLCDQRYHVQEAYPENLQGECSLGDSRSHSQEEGPVCPQGMTSLGDIRSHNQEEDPESPQGTAPLRDSRIYSQKECPVMPQTYPLGKSKSHSQEEGVERPKGTSPLEGSRRHRVKKRPKKQQAQGQKAKQPKGKKASESQHQEKLASGCSSVNWDCPCCKAKNFSWRKACYKCKKVRVAVESEGLDPGQTH
ncbi:putative testis-expressed protein 13C [Equus asinus]|uniref:putative testis-expressed protein 13C n=1 Tax=Equus asinus TaxID=9793 RepID=UPI0038F5FEE6